MGISDPTVDPANPVNNNSNRVFQITWTHGDGVTYNCETSPSRDTYAGLTFGLLTAFDMLGPDGRRPPGRRSATTSLAMGEFLLKYGWNYPRPHGYVSTKHDFDGASPRCSSRADGPAQPRPTPSGTSAGGGTPAHRLKWNAVWDEELATAGPAARGRRWRSTRCSRTTATTSTTCTT